MLLTSVSANKIIPSRIVMVYLDVTALIKKLGVDHLLI